MTRKDFQLIADTLHYCVNHCDTDEERNLLTWVSNHMADALSTPNSNFNHARFLAACGVEA